VGTVKKVRTRSPDSALVARRRREIVLVSTQVFIKKGYDRTNVRELSGALGMTKGGLYHYIGSKDDILYLILDYISKAQKATFIRMRCRTKNLNAREALRESMRIYIEGVDKLQNFYNFLNHVIVNLEPQERKTMYVSEGRMVAYFETLLKDGIQAGEFKICDPTLTAHNILMLGNTWANRRWFLRKKYTLGEYTREQTRLILQVVSVDGR
jgi:AcrR family transcriptional regulator